VVGLGNPGERYDGTRHNAGFMVIDSLVSSLQIAVKREECKALVGRGVVDGSVVELAKPQTFMNLSGDSVSCLLRKPERAIEKLIVIYDDLALPLGTIRVRPKGSHGGQNGMRSIIGCLGTEDFVRIRIGIAPDHPVGNASDFVLARFSSSDREKATEAIGNAASAAIEVMTSGVESSMQKFN